MISLVRSVRPRKATSFTARFSSSASEAQNSAKPSAGSHESHPDTPEAKASQTRTELDKVAEKVASAEEMNKVSHMDLLRQYASAENLRREHQEAVSAISKSHVHSFTADISKLVSRIGGLEQVATEAKTTISSLPKSSESDAELQSVNGFLDGVLMTNHLLKSFAEKHGIPLNGSDKK